MKRRTLITLLGGASVARPGAVGAQATKVRTIGLLDSRTSAEEARYFSAFRQGLQALGWTEGKNVKFEQRYASGNFSHLSSLAAELVSLAPDVILGITPPAVQALRRRTQSVPIVFVRMTDPVRQGFVSNLAHPGGNMTGFTSYDFSLGTKWLQLLKEIAPRITRVVLEYDTRGSANFLGALEAAARSTGLQVASLPLENMDDLRRLAVLGGNPNTGLIALPNFFADGHRREIVALAAREHLPAIYNDSDFVAAGGLLSYDTDLSDVFRRAASYVDRILRGAKPGDLPIQKPTRWVLSVNLRTANALGLVVPQSILLQAAEIIK